MGHNGIVLYMVVLGIAGSQGNSERTADVYLEIPLLLLLLLLLLFLPLYRHSRINALIRPSPFSLVFWSTVDPDIHLRPPWALAPATYRQKLRQNYYLRD